MCISGTFIPIEDHHLLREDFEEFEEGEYVGYEIEDDLQQNGQTFVYAIIMDKVSVNVKNWIVNSIISVTDELFARSCSKCGRTFSNKFILKRFHW